MSTYFKICIIFAFVTNNCKICDKNIEMGKHLNSVYSSIQDWIVAHGEGKIYFLNDFNSFEADSVRQAFVRLVNDEIVIRLSPGIFLYPLKTRFGIAYPSDYEIAKEIARRDSASILPSGMTAANMIGLSEQVPMKSVFLTDGTARTICVNGRDIIFKRGVPKNFTYKSRTIPLVVAGMKAMGNDYWLRRQDLISIHCIQIYCLLQNGLEK